MDYIEEMHDHAFQNDCLIVGGAAQELMLLKWLHL